MSGEELKSQQSETTLYPVEKIPELRARMDRLEALITKFHAAKGRHHTQLAACDLFDAVGLKNERPVK